MVDGKGPVTKGGFLIVGVLTGVVQHILTVSHYSQLIDNYVN